MPEEYYIQKGGRQLRCGYTTGSCAALAAKAALLYLLTGAPPPEVEIETPKGVVVRAPVHNPQRSGAGATCSVQKDAGDDVDVTDGMHIFATVTLCAGQNGVIIDGGAGIGRVTRPGLEQPVGKAAINHTPREMITKALLQVCAEHQTEGGVHVLIWAPKGAEIAARTFNARLGIEGGISILGTSGMVEPHSEQAMQAAIAAELKMLRANGQAAVILTPGNYGEHFALRHFAALGMPVVQCSNYIGEALDSCRALEFKRVVLIGHIGKFGKLAAGVMHTHSRVADARAEIFCAHAALAGADKKLCAALMAAVSSDACIALLDAHNLRRPVLDSVLAAAQRQVQRRVGEKIEAEMALFTNRYGLLACTPGLEKYDCAGEGEEK